MQISQRVLGIQPSKTVELSVKIEELKKQGKDIIGLNVGEPDFPTPNFIKDGTIDAIKDNHTKYGHVSGLVTLREKIAENISKDISCDNLKLSANNILISNGSKQIIYNIFQTICNPDDEVIVFKPYWVTFPESIKLAGGVPVFVDSKDNFQLDLEKFESAITLSLIHI